MQHELDLFKRRLESSEAMRTNLHNELLIENQERLKADAALQSYVSSFSELRSTLLKLIESSPTMTRSQVIEQLKGLMQP